MVRGQDATPDLDPLCGCAARRGGPLLNAIGQPGLSLDVPALTPEIDVGPGPAP